MFLIRKSSVVGQEMPRFMFTRSSSPDLGICEQEKSLILV